MNDGHHRPAVTVDLAIFTVRKGTLEVLLITRGVQPFEGALALPGGFVRVGPSATDQGEGLLQAAHRELAEETGLPEGSCYLAQCGTFGEPGRDPRERVITVAHVALVPPLLADQVHAGSDAQAVRWTPVGALPPLAFDHNDIVLAALSHVRVSIDRTDLAASLLPVAFSVADLRAVHEAVFDTVLDRHNFHRKFRRLVEDGLVEPTADSQATGGRSARLYRFAHSHLAGPK